MCNKFVLHNTCIFVSYKDVSNMYISINCNDASVNEKLISP